MNESQKIIANVQEIEEMLVYCKTCKNTITISDFSRYIVKKHIIHIYCPVCQVELEIPVETREAGSYKILCPNGHRLIINIKQPLKKRKILVEIERCEEAIKPDKENRTYIVTLRVFSRYRALIGYERYAYFYCNCGEICKIEINKYSLSEMKRSKIKKVINCRSGHRYEIIELIDLCNIEEKIGSTEYKELWEYPHYNIKFIRLRIREIDDV
jgi:hypothetical protein